MKEETQQSQENRIAANEVDKIQQAIKKSGLKKPEWARNALISAASV
jgi:hypothetical protein